MKKHSMRRIEMFKRSEGPLTMGLLISAVQTCVLTALALVPTKVLIFSDCFSALKN